MWTGLDTAEPELLNRLAALDAPALDRALEAAVAERRGQGADVQETAAGLVKAGYQASLAGRRALGRALYAKALSEGGLAVDKLPRAHRPHALSHVPELQARIAETCARRKVVYITGCARSGTTLTIRCVGATARGATVFWREGWLSSILDVEDAPTIVLKRSGVDHHFFDLVPPEAHVLHVVRHPADTCTSRMPGRDGYYVTPERWLAEFKAARSLIAAHPAERLIVLRYEDLLAEPDAEQMRIARQWTLAFDLPFSRYHERNALDTSLDREGRAYVWPPIDADAAYRHRISDRDAEQIAAFTGALGTAYAEFCAMFGYDAHDGRG